MIISLEVKDFKSYKGLHVIGPFKSFSCIIGPNGSGKSNLMDAIIFVFGFKSTQIRSHNISELIYFGANMENPDTYVKLVYFDQKTSKTYEVMRKITGKGTQYFINNKVLSLSEYSEQLEQLGINMKSKNFFIFQGDVESYANQTPKQLTSLIESVSGSEEHRRNYDEYLSKKNKAEDEVLACDIRRKNIIQERERFKEEWSEAKVYHNMQSRIDDLRSNQQLAKLYHTRKLIDKESSLLDKFRGEIAECREEMKPIENEQTRSSLSQANTHKELMSLEDSIEKLTKKKKKTTESIKNQEEIKIINDKIKKTRNLLNKYEERKELQVREIEQLRVELSDNVSELERLEKENQDVMDIGNNIKMDNAQIEEYNKLKLESGKETSSLKIKLDQLNREHRLDNDRVKSLQSKIIELERMKDQFQENSQRFTVQKENETEMYKQIESYLKQAENDQKNIIEELGKAENTNKELQSRLESTQLRLNELVSSKSESQREAKFKFIVDSLKTIYSGVYGKLGDFCEPSQKKYSVALSLILGKMTDAIIVDNSSTLEYCLAHLKQQRLGVATFISLDRCDSLKPINSKLRQLGGSAKLLFDVVKLSDKSMEKALQYVVGNTVVCDTTAEAKLLAFGGKERIKVVTRDGVKITKSGLISGGGSYSKGPSKPWDIKEIDKLKKDRDEILSKLSDVSDINVKFNEKQQITSQLNEFKSNLSLTKSRMEAANERFKKNQSELVTIDNELSSTTPEKQTLQNAIDKRSKDIEKLENEILKIEDKYFKEFSRKFNVDNIREFEDNRLAKVQENIQKRLQVNEFITKIQSKINYEEGKHVDEEINQLKLEINNNEKLLSDEMESKKALDEKEDEMNNKFVEMSSLYNDRKKEMDQMNKEIKDHKTKISKILSLITELKKKCGISEFKLTKLKSLFHDILIETRNENIFLSIKDKDQMDVEEEEEEEEEDDSKSKRKKGKKKVTSEDEEEEEEDEEEESKKSKKSKKPAKPTSSRSKKSVASSKKRGRDDEKGSESESEKKKKSGSKRKAGASDSEKESESEGDSKKKKKDSKEKDIFKDEDEEIVESDYETNFGKENPIGNFVRDLSQSMTDSDKNELFDSELEIPIQYKSIQKLKLNDQISFDEYIKKCDVDIATIQKTMEQVMPNHKAYESLKKVYEDLKLVNKELESLRSFAKEANEFFAETRAKRKKLFMKAFKKISKNLGRIYSELTKELESPYKGSAHLAIEDVNNPYNAGVKYTVIPPNKRFQEMDQLSGGEKSVAALALLFSLQGTKSPPFLILDEIDAAFDTVNVLKLVLWVRSKASRDLQFLVISLKELFYVHSDLLVGVCREVDSTSKSYTLLLENFPDEADKFIRKNDGDEELNTSTSSATSSDSSSSSSEDEDENNDQTKNILNSEEEEEEEADQ